MSGAAHIYARFQVQWPGFTLDVDLTLPAQGITALFGHSGSGKTTLLRCIAGLETASSGFLKFQDRVWQDSAQHLCIPTHQRPLGYVFQEASLFPHLSVQGNLDYAQKRARGAQRIALQPLLELLGIQHLRQRMPQHLSGGERQRVAIARALATNPQLLLMDEPLAALDMQRKQEILPYLERLRDQLEIPMLYVSHVPDEVARLADYLVLLEEGRVLAAGNLQSTLARLDLPLAQSADAGVVIEARVVSYDAVYHLSKLEFHGGSVWVAPGAERLGQRQRLRIHARDVSLSLHRAEGSSILNLLPATVSALAAADTPAHVLVQLDCGGTPILARITRRSQDQLQIAPGKALWAQIKAVALLN